MKATTTSMIQTRVPPSLLLTYTAVGSLLPGSRISRAECFLRSGVARECREMRGPALTRTEIGGPTKRKIGGRNCHRKHVEDG
ncbi:CBL-interacting serine/threonine-protein kinase 6 [Senna tora]|uniref:CBL-interacting serine/threonine-protein kinase 6 n=1 Tax=Senna tora TaxID=362788 RepID=A0A835CE71_9FABA|nr:CBL-interacting serine/threonine-protein kinase 6 [Senna tora]